VSKLIRDHAVDAVVNFAAESHVDRSIVAPGSFIETNVVATFHTAGVSHEGRRNVWLRALDKVGLGFDS